MADLNFRKIFSEFMDGKRKSKLLAEKQARVKEMIRVQKEKDKLAKAAAMPKNYIECDACNGSGIDEGGSYRCHVCAGRGKIKIRPSVPPAEVVADVQISD